MEIVRWTDATREMARIASIAAEVIEHHSILGAFRPKRAETFVPYARRVEYAGSGRHHVSANRRPGAWLRSLLRDAGDALFGAFTTPEEARA